MGKGVMTRKHSAEIAAYHTFIIPLVGAECEGAREAGTRLEFAIPLAKQAAIQEDSPRLVTYLLEAVQYELIFGLTEAEIADDLEQHAGWWQERMEAGISPKEAAREAVGQAA
jgi:hypothetical protein